MRALLFRLFFFSVCAFLFPSLTKADSVPVLTQEGPLVTLEGLPLDVSFQFTNPTSQPTVPVSFTFSSPTFASGDPTDVFNGLPPVAQTDTCTGQPLAPGGSCTLTLRYTFGPLADNVAEDGNSGISTGGFVVIDQTTGFTIEQVTYPLTVDDPVSTPEPSSWLLTVAGLGLLGLTRLTGGKVTGAPSARFL
jgi:hypothetical protein